MSAPRYMPPNGDAVDFNLLAYAPPAGGAVDFDLGREQEAAPVRLLSPGGTAIGWRGKMRRVDGHVGVCWSRPRQIDPPLRLAWRGDAPLRAPHVRIPWGETRHIDPEGTRIPWRQNRPRAGGETRVPWAAGHMRKDAPPLRAPWGILRRRDHEAILLRLFPLRRIDWFLAIPWGTLHPRDNEFRVPWRAWKPRRDIPYRVYWGRALYERICRRDYEPPDGDRVDFDLVQLLSQTGDGDHTDFFFDPLAYDLRCAQREPSGWRDNHFYQPKTYPHAPRLEALVVINTAWITRLPDNAPVQAYSVDLSADMDSWCWSFTARIPAASLPMVMTPLDPTELQVNINGHTWNVLAESWRESHSFARSEYTIQGRSRSCVLAAPFAPETSGGNTATRTAQQLAAEQLEYTQWTLDWRIPDWTVPPGALSYSNASPVKVIQQIAEAAAGRVQTHRTAQRLIILPRIPAAPWKWGDETPALGISDYVVRNLSREYQPAPACNGVYVSGEHQGVLCLVKRAGTDGAALAPMVTDALITATEAARARGIWELGRTGHWSKEGLDMPLTRSGDLPGLLEIGTLVTMQEGNGVWRGQVVGLKISASFDAGGGLTVSQHVDVERYRGS